MSDYLSDSPVAVDALIGALDAEAGQGTSDTPPTPADAPKAGQEAPKPGAEPSQTPAGTTEQKPKEGATAPTAAPTQSPFPKELEPYKPLFEKKKWDPAKPDWQGEALKTLSEQEQFQGRLTTDLGLTRTQAAELSQALLGTPKDINAYRERMGLQPLPFESTSLEDRYKAAEADWQTLQDALSEDQKVSVPATRRLVDAFKAKLEGLALDKKLAERNPPKAGQDNTSEAKVNWARILERDPDANKAMTALVPFLKTKVGVGLLGSFGMDPQNIMATPERAQQAYELAQRLHRGDPQVFEAEVQKRVTAEMERQRQLQVQGGIPGGAPAAASPTRASDPAMEHLALVR